LPLQKGKSSPYLKR